MHGYQTYIMHMRGIRSSFVSSPSCNFVYPESPVIGVISNWGRTKILRISQPLTRLPTLDSRRLPASSSFGRPAT